MRLRLESAGAIGLLASGRNTLVLGEEVLTVSVPAEKLHKSLNDGPWNIRGVQIFRPEGNSFGDFVETGNLNLQTAAYKRDELDRGNAFSDEGVTTRGLYPAVSGRFRLIEIQLGIVTPGGQCGWYGSLGMEGYESSTTTGSAVLPQGRTVLSFIFDGAMVARAPKPNWYFQPLVGCGSINLADDHAKPLISVTLDRTQFEPQASFFVHLGNLQMRPGEERKILVDIRGTNRANVGLRVGEPVPGIDVTFPGTYQDVGFATRVPTTVKTDPSAKAGRFFVPIIATTDSERVDTALVVDVLP
jgi:hypothetical protein